MLLYISNDTKITLGSIYEEAISKAVESTLVYESIPSDNIEISVTLVTNDEIQKLNNKYKQNDKPTDVLSFPQFFFNNDTNKNIIEIKKYLSEHNSTNTESIILGDVIISLEKAISQSDEYHHSLERELAFLTAHSILHLLGYDHIQYEDEKTMFTKQTDILKYLPR